jgi:hypothetical protein
MDAVRTGFRLELLQIFVEMDKRMFLDGRGERAQFFPFRNSAHFPIALLP